MPPADVKMRATDSDCIMSHGQAPRCPQTYKKAQIMQITALLLFSLFTLSLAQNVVPQTPSDAEAPPAQEEANTNGTVSYVLTHSDDITEAALQEKCQNLNCSRIIYRIIKGIVVNTDPTAVNTLSVDPLLNAAAENVQVSLH